jgi:hypothetical protein
MSYRSDFYIPENIIGYTGHVDRNPTVYFRNLLTQEFGHITQNWNDDFFGMVLSPNVGRETVHVDPTYTIVNTGGHCVETGATYRHTSRTPITFLVAGGAGLSVVRFKLSTAIAKFTEEKSWDHISAGEKDQLLDYGRIKRSEP